MPPPPKTDPPGQRRHARFAVDWRVSLTCKDWRMAGRVAAANASRGGIFLYTTRPAPIGTPVELTIQLPDGTRLPLRGTVQHVVTAEQAAQGGGGAGIGVRIDAEHATDLLLLEQMARAAEEEGGPREPASAATAPGAGEPPAPDPDQLAPPELGDAPRPARASSATTLPPPQTAPQPAPPQARVTPGGSPVPQKLARIAVASSRSAAPTLPRNLPICPVLGIDFGTTYTSVAVTLGDLVYLVPDDEGRVLHPSVVSYPEKAPLVVGWAARERLAHDPRHTVVSAKRLLGHRFSDVDIGGHLQSVPYKTLAGPADVVVIEIDEERYAVPQVCAAVIAHVRDLAEQALEQRFSQVALSCPVSYAEEQKQALRRAAQLAGLEVVAMVPEPVAGAMAYGIGQEKNEIVAVYDFGGGTFDFSLLDMAGDHVRLIASEGDAWLGGDDFDLLVAQAVADAFWRATKIELRQRVVEWQRLLLACETAKRDLSNESQAAIVVDELIELPRRIDLRQRIDRALFERLTRALFERSLEVCGAALARAGLEPTDVTQVVVTGGVSRIPYVRQGLAAYFEREIDPVVNPEEAIALGAGMRGAQAAEHPVRGVARRA